jgi:hypothetical protein
LDIEKYHPTDGEDDVILSTRGVRRILSTLSGETLSDVDSTLLSHFDIHSNYMTKKISAKAAESKPLDKSKLTEYLRTAFPEQNIETNWVIPGTDKTIDLFIRSESKKLAIAIICDEHRSRPLIVSEDEKTKAFSLKAATGCETKWLLFDDYNAKRPTLGFFVLIAEIKGALYGPFPDKVKSTPKKTKKPKKDKEKDTEGKKKEKSKKEKSEDKKKEKSKDKKEKSKEKTKSKKSKE